MRTIQLTNHGEIAAPIVDPLADLLARGQLRPAQRPISILRSVVRRKSDMSSAAIIAETRRAR